MLCFGTFQILKGFNKKKKKIKYKILVKSIFIQIKHKKKYT